MSSTALYSDLSGYYDLMCADINYLDQSEYVHRLHQLLGNQGKDYLDLACGTGPHLRHFINFGYSATGLDINQPMLDIAQLRCPEAKFIQQDMSNFTLPEQVDLISCFLYSIHYNADIDKLKESIACAHAALRSGGIFCFNAVDKQFIDNREGIKHSLTHDNSQLTFQSSWYYCGKGDHQELQLCIEKITGEHIEIWRDNHPMTAINFQFLRELLLPYFEVHIFEHDFNKIVPWGETTGNAIFVGVKI